MKKFWIRKPKQEKPKSFVQEWYNAIVFAVVFATLIRWSVVQAFVIPTPSMENSLLVGDYLFVSKFHYGPQTPKTPLQFPLTHQKFWGTDIPSYLDWIQLPAYRLPGISHVKRSDVVVFNIPPASLNGGVDFPSDIKTNYVKRCVGLPGDTLSISDTEIIVNHQPLPLPAEMKFGYIVVSQDQINERNLRRIGIDENDYFFRGHRDDSKAVYFMLLTRDQVTALKNFSFVISADRDKSSHETSSDRLFPIDHPLYWNQDNYGPIIIPKKGMTIDINDSTLSLYGDAITLYDGNKDATISKGKLTINNSNITQYTFRQDYFFMVGDNRHNSLDSRYWGFAPEDHIVGKALFVWMSLDDHAKLLNKIRWSRIGKIIH